MSGSAIINQNNEVYLESGKTIELIGGLTGQAPAAKIKPANYSPATRVLTGTITYLTPVNIAKFELEDYQNGGWAIRDTGSPGFLIQAAARRGSVYYPTLAEAIAAASGTQDVPDVITILKNIYMDAAVLDNKHIVVTVPYGSTKTLTRTPTGTVNPVFTVNTGSSLTLEGNGAGKLILDGGGSLTASGALINVDGSFTLNAGAVLQNNNNTGGGGGWGGGVYVLNSPSAVFTMNGGEISGNVAVNGGAVYVNNSGNFVMTGGTIGGDTVQRNAANNAGGGVYVSLGASFTMSGGEIS
jgi:hypothetical protein